MEYRSLGRTGLQVSNLCLGGMMLGAFGNTDHDDAVRIVHAALDGGVNIIDTADAYSHGESEEIIGKALGGGRRHDVVLATKFHHPVGDADRNARGNSRRYVARAVEASLRRLRTDHIDLYQVHRPDPSTDLAETLGALTDLQRAGKIRYFGTSTFPAHELVAAQWTAERASLSRFVSEQPPYSALVRGIEADVLPVCQESGIGVMTWSPLAGGFLSGRYRRGADATSRRGAGFPPRYDPRRPENRAKLEATYHLADLAAQHELSLIQLAIGFVLEHPAVSTAIIGPRTMEHLSSQLAAADTRLSAEILDAVDEIVPPGRSYTWSDAGYTPPGVADASSRRSARLMVRRFGQEARRTGSAARCAAEMETCRAAAMTASV